MLDFGASLFEPRSVFPSGSKHNFRQDTAEVAAAAPQRASHAKRSAGRLSGCERVSTCHSQRLNRVGVGGPLLKFLCVSVSVTVFFSTAGARSFLHLLFLLEPQ